MGYDRALRRLRDFLFERGGLVALATLVVYVWVAPNHIVDGDNAEFAALGHLGGAAHPSGYPLYVLWLRATSWIVPSDPAHATAIATAVLGVIQVFVLHAACRAWGARSSAASVAVGMFAAGPIVIRIQTEAEVFALNGLICAAILWLSASRAPLRGTARIAALGVLAGLGIANHLTSVLLAPVGVLGVVRGMRESTRVRPLLVGVGIVALVVGLLPYLYLLVAPDHDVSWGAVRSFEELVDHFLRRAYGGPFAFSSHPQPIDVFENLKAFTLGLGRVWLWLPLVAGVCVLAIRCARSDPEREPRWGWWCLTATFIIAGPLLAGRLDVPPVGIGLYAVQRFYVLPALLLAIPVALAFDKAFAWGSTRVELRLLRRWWVPNTIASLVFVAAAALSLPHLTRTHSPALEQGLRNTLKSLPPNAVFMESQQIYLFGMGYLQLVEGIRPDVTLVSWSQMSLPWYQARCARKGLVFQPNADEVASVRMAEQVLAQGRPLVVDELAGNVLKSFPSYPFGIVFRVLPRGTPVPSLDELAELNKSLFDGFELGYQFPGADDEFATDMHLRYARTWRIIGEAFVRAGRTSDAAWAFDIMKQIGPRPD